MAVKFSSHFLGRIALCQTGLEKLRIGVYMPFLILSFIWAPLCEKVPNALSRCHTKRRMVAHGHAHPSFGMTLTF